VLDRRLSVVRPPEANKLQLVIHNSFIQVLSETGILGFAVFLVAPWLILSGLMESAKKVRLPSMPALWRLRYGAAIACGLSGGFTYTWWPYIFIGLIAAAKHVLGLMYNGRTQCSSQLIRLSSLP
jgi:O-antigen ligase